VNLWDSLNAVGELLPPALLVEEMSRNGIEEVRVAPIPFMAQYDVDTGVLTLNPNIDRTGVALRFSRRWCVIVDPADVYVAILFHEISHHLNRDKDKLAAGRHRWEARKEAEVEADEFARKKFEAWKRGER
jgi:hypothetical protein